MPDLEAFLQFGVEVARRAGQMMSDGQATLKLSHKADHTPVTDIDQAINAMVIQSVKDQYPSHGVRGEEESYHDDAEWLWVCDPIDGTVAFITHVPMSAFSLALVHNGQPVVAVVYNPWVNKLFTAIKGQGAQCNDQPIHVSTRHDGRALIATRGANGFSGFFGGQDAKNVFKQKGWTLIHAAGIVYKSCLIAEGALDGTVYHHTGAHDIAAVALIVPEAGGKVTDIAGKPQGYDRPINGAIVSNGYLHDELLEVITTLGTHVEV